MKSYKQFITEEDPFSICKKYNIENFINIYPFTYSSF